MDFDRYNDGSENAPRLRLQQSFWGMEKLPMNAAREWTPDEKFSRCKEAGFEAVECWSSEQHDVKAVAPALQTHGLRLAMGHRPFTVEDTRKQIELAVKLGADYLFTQPADAFTPLEQVAKIMREGRKIANDLGLHYFVEVHRGNYTENLPQALRLLEAVPELRFTGDFSHFVVVGEFYGWEEEGAVERMRPILERVSHLHGRVSNGEAVQVHVANEECQEARFFVEIWATCMKAWRHDAQPGDVFPFTSELGPPRYAITLPDGREFSDRWEQALMMKRLAEIAWEKAA